ncbi:hypothetical protein FRB98_003723 [Tulasnella sp. 332]|nr:hypothetical protein FRB98_003723 [Tulasnella sp. 332]
MTSIFPLSPRATPNSSERVIPPSLVSCINFESNPNFGKENVAPPVLLIPTASSSSLGSCPLTPPSSSPIKPLPPSQQHQLHALQLKAPRVIFSQTNRHHPYAHKPRTLPSSKMIKPPAKSILKRLPTSSSSLHDATTSTATTREPTPEPVDPLSCIEFLKTPVDALVASLSMAEYTMGLEQLFKPSQHDLTEAYGTLGSRLRAHFKGSGGVELTSDVVALSPLKTHAEDLAKVFVRDMGKPITDPGSLSSDSSDESFTDTSSTQSADELTVPGEPSSSPIGATKKPKKKGVSAAQITYARDAFMLTQAAIRTVATILSSPVLYGCFSDSSLSTILQVLLAIPLAPKLYTPNARKTTMLAMWCLQNQRLSEAALRPSVNDFIEALARAIRGELGKEGKKGAACEALLAVQVMCRDHPALFLPHAHPLLVPILERCLPNANNTSTHLRSRGPLALGGIAMGILNWRACPSSEGIDQARNTMANTLKGWFDASIPSPKKGKKALVSTSTPAQHPSEELADTILNALSASITPSADASSTTVDSPQWAFTLLTSLTVTLGAKLFESPGAWGLMCQAVTIALRKSTNGMGPAVVTPSMKHATRAWWSSVVWCASQLNEEGEAGVGGNESVWKLVESVRGSAVCAAVVGRHVRMGRAGVKRAVRYVGETIREGQQAGIHVLARLVNARGYPTLDLAADAAFDTDRMIARPFIDGSFLNTSSGAFGAFVKDIVEGEAAAMMGSQDVRTLDLDEMRGFFNELVGVWEDMMGRVKFVTTEAGAGGCGWEPPQVVLDIWEALVKAVDVDAEDHGMLEALKSAMSAFLVPNEDLNGQQSPGGAKGMAQKAPYPRGVPGSARATPSSALVSRRGSSSSVSSVAYTVDYEEEEEVESIRAVAALAFSRQLWDTVRNHLPTSNTTDTTDTSTILGEIATTLVTTSLFDPSAFPLLASSSSSSPPSSPFTSSTLFCVWSDFVVDALVHCPLASVEDVASRLGWDEEEDGVGRCLWAVWCRRLEVETGLEWREGMMILGVPFGGDDSTDSGGSEGVPAVSMRQHELELWTALFERVVESANCRAEAAEVVGHVVTLLASCGPIEVPTSFKVCTALVRAITSFPSFVASLLDPLLFTSTESTQALPSLPHHFNAALRHISAILICVPPSTLTIAEDHDCGMDLINALGSLLKGLAAIGLGEVGLVEVLKSLEEGMCAWFKAPQDGQDGVLSWEVERYNRLIVPLYITALDVLQTSNYHLGSQIPPSWETLHTLQTLFASPLNGAPPPSLAAQAFASFFFANYHAGDRASQADAFVYPEMLKPALRALRVVVGGEMVPALSGLSYVSSDGESQNAVVECQGEISNVSGLGYEADVSSIRWNMALNDEAEPEVVVNSGNGAGRAQADATSGLDGVPLDATDSDTVVPYSAVHGQVPAAAGEADMVIPASPSQAQILVPDSQPRSPSPLPSAQCLLLSNPPVSSPSQLERVLVVNTPEADREPSGLVVPDSEPERALLASLLDAASRRHSAELSSPARALSPLLLAPNGLDDCEPAAPDALMEAFVDFSNCTQQDAVSEKALQTPRTDVDADMQALEVTAGGDPTINSPDNDADPDVHVSLARNDTNTLNLSPLPTLPSSKIRGRVSTLSPTRSVSRTPSKAQISAGKIRVAAPSLTNGRKELVSGGQPDKVTGVDADDEEEAIVASSLVVPDSEDENEAVTPLKRKQDRPNVLPPKKLRARSPSVSDSQPGSTETSSGTSSTRTDDKGHQLSKSASLLDQLIVSDQPHGILKNYAYVAEEAVRDWYSRSSSPASSPPLETPIKMAKKSASRPSKSRVFAREVYVEIPTLKECMATSRVKAAPTSRRLASTKKQMPRRQSDIFDGLSETETRPSTARKRFVGPACRDPARKRNKPAPVPSPRKRRATSRLIDQSDDEPEIYFRQSLTPGDTASHHGSDDAPIGLARAIMSSALKRKARDHDEDEDGDTEPNVSPTRGYVDGCQQRPSLTRSKSVGNISRPSRPSPPRTRSATSGMSQFRTGLLQVKTSKQSMSKNEIMRAITQMAEVQHEFIQLLKENEAVPGGA